MTDRTNAERQRRFIKRLKEKAAEAVSNAQTVSNAEAVSNAKLEARIRALEAELARERQSKTPKPKRPPIDPESEVAKLRKSNRELRAQMEKIKWQVRMPSTTYSKVAKCLHQDTASQATQETRDEALGLLTQWKAVHDGRRP
jgi:hypothetical protein